MAGNNDYFEKNEQTEAQRAAEMATTNLTALHFKGGLEPVLGRDTEIDRICEILMRRRKSNVLLVGEPGVGKTALVEGIAARMASSADPALASRPVLQVSLGALVAGARYRGDFEARLETLVESARTRRAVLFLDEMQMLIGAGSTGERSMDGANMLKPALARDGLSVIGATTHEELDQVSADRALMRRFETVRIREPGLNVMREIVPGAAKPYLSYHGVTAAPRTLNRLVDFADQYLPGRRFPDKAFDLIDGACVSARVGGRKRVSIGDIRASVRRLGGTLQSVRSEARLQERPIREELMRHIGGQDAAMHRIAAIVARSGHNAPPRIVLQGPSGVGKRSAAAALARALGMNLFQPDKNLPAADFSRQIRTALEKEPATLVSIDMDALPGRDERRVAEEMASSEGARGGMGPVITSGAVVLRRSTCGEGVGFRPVMPDGLGDLPDDVVLMPGFLGEALLSAVRFELSRLCRIRSDAGDIRPRANVDFVAKSIKSASPRWTDIHRACENAIKVDRRDLTNPKHP